MSNRVIDHLVRVWKGPPVRVAAGGETWVLGAGGGAGAEAANVEPATEVIVHNAAVLRRMLTAPSLAFGEGYMSGDIEVRGELKDVLRGVYETGGELASGPTAALLGLLARLPRRTSSRRAVANARHHYDVGNGFYQLWLDPTLTYSCGYFLADEDTIADAQRQKLELLCRKLRLQAGQSMLDIGCGWGGLLFHAARRFGVQATGITPSRQQADHIEARAREEGLGGRVRVLRGEWRELEGTYDRVVSVGMFEHVGRAQYPAFFRRWRGLIKPGGLSLLHSIGRMQPAVTDAWIQKYIFPGGYLPALGEIVGLAARRGLSVLDVENLWQHYARTLACWSANYQQAWDQVVDMFDERFARMWWLYLQGAESAFRWGDLQLWQVVIGGEGTIPWPLDRNVRMDQEPRGGAQTAPLKG